jgi:hypothetical protein
VANRLGIVLGVASLVVAAAAAPLGVYALTIACFGFAHVACETRYVDGRFSRRLPRRLIAIALAIAGGVVVARACFAAGLLPRAYEAPVELTLLAALAASTVPFATSRTAKLIAAAVVAIVGAGVLFAPAASFAVFALVHNVTPLGFLVEAAPKERRARTAATWSALLFGAPAAAFVAAGFVDVGLADITPFSLGELRDHVAAFVPPSLDGERAKQLFAAGACAQSLHYAATILVLPRVAAINDDRGHRVPWPKSFAVVVIAASTAFFALFAVAFVDARALYGVPAAFHAWIEIPVLLTALSAAPARRGPRRSGG